MPLPPKPVFGCLWAPGKRTEPTRLLEIPFLVFSPHLSQLYLLHTQTPGTLGWLGEGQGRRSTGPRSHGPSGALGLGRRGVWTLLPGSGTVGLFPGLYRGDRDTCPAQLKVVKLPLNVRRSALNTARHYPNASS